MAAYFLKVKNHHVRNNCPLVIGCNHQNPLGVIEALGQKGIFSDVIINTTHKSSFVLKSKYVNRGWICPTNQDVIECITDNIYNCQDKVVVYACSDNMACLLNDNYSILNNGLILPGINTSGELSKMMRKDNMTNIAKEIGLNVPDSWLICDGHIPQDISYPCVTKSLSSVNYGKSEFTLCSNENELLSFLNRTHSKTIQVQEYIDKEFEFQYLGCSLNCGEQIIIPGRTHIESTSHFNNLTFLKYQESKVVESPATLQKTEEFIRRSKYSGLFSVEFMHGRDGKDYFLEMNFRNDGNGVVVTAAGTNLPFIWYLYNTGGDYMKEIEKSRVKETYSAPEDSYFISMMEGHISFREWRNNMKKVSCYITYFPGDTKPFWSMMWLQKKPLCVSVLKRLLRVIHIKK